MRNRLHKTAQAFAVALAFIATAASAQTYPNRPIRIVVPYPPGNASDTVSRMLGDQLLKRLGQQIVVDNRPGASGGIGARLAARATPDGYTLLMTSTSFTINTAITANLMYDVEKDFEPVAMVASGGGMVLLESLCGGNPNFFVAPLVSCRHYDDRNVMHVSPANVERLYKPASPSSASSSMRAGQVTESTTSAYELRRIGLNLAEPEHHPCLSGGHDAEEDDSLDHHVG